MLCGLGPLDAPMPSRAATAPVKTNPLNLAAFPLVLPVSSHFRGMNDLQSWFA
jgi:hypothetical protein